MTCQRLYLVPMFLCVFVPLSVLITFTITVHYDHVGLILPYISDTGAYPPESCIFSLLLNIAAFIMLGCVYVRYLQIAHYTATGSPGKYVSERFNKLSGVTGAVSCVGLLLVANFQVVILIEVHLTGAMSCFGAGIAYFAMQVWISYKLPILTSKRVLFLRLGLVILLFTVTIITVFGGMAAYNIYPGTYDTARHWKPEERGWGLHLLSTISEWILCLSYSLLILSFVPDMRDYELVLPKVMPKIHVEKKYSIDP